MLTSRSHRKRPGQTALEFMIVISILLVLFAAVFTVFSRREIEALEKETKLQANEIADMITYHLDLALVQGSGFSQQFKLPAKLGTNSYRVVINQTGKGSVVFVEWDDRFASSYAAAPRINGSLKPGNNWISNRQGVLYVN